MKTTILTAILFFIFQFSFAQSKSEKEIADVVEQLRVAMVDANKASLETLTDDKLSYGHSSGHIEGKKEFVEKIVTGQSDFVTLEFSDQTISISDNVAIVRHILIAKTNDAGKGPGEVNLKVLLIWQHQKSGWKLLARQAVKNS